MIDRNSNNKFCIRYKSHSRLADDEVVIHQILFTNVHGTNNCALAILLLKFRIDLGCIEPHFFRNLRKNTKTCELWADDVFFRLMETNAKSCQHWGIFTSAPEERCSQRRLALFLHFKTL